MKTYTSERETVQTIRAPVRILTRVSIPFFPSFYQTHRADGINSLRKRSRMMSESITDRCVSGLFLYVCLCSGVQS